MIIVLVFFCGILFWWGERRAKASEQEEIEIMEKYGVEKGEKFVIIIEKEKQPERKEVCLNEADKILWAELAKNYQRAASEAFFIRGMPIAVVIFGPLFSVNYLGDYKNSMIETVSIFWAAFAIALLAYLSEIALLSAGCI